MWARAGAGTIDAFLVQFYNQVQKKPSVIKLGSVIQQGGRMGRLAGLTSTSPLSLSLLTLLVPREHHSPLLANSQGAGCYVTYGGTFTDSYAGGACSAFPGTAVSQIASYGVPMKSIVVGKYLINGVDASNGYVAPATLHSWYDTAAAQYGFTSGFMIWQWSASQAPAWAAAV